MDKNLLLEKKTDRHLENPEKNYQNTFGNPELNLYKIYFVYKRILRLAGRKQY